MQSASCRLVSGGEGVGAREVAIDDNPVGEVKESPTTIIGDLTPACGCADATLVLATTAPAIRRQDWDSNPQPLADKLNCLPTEQPRS